MMLAGEFNSAVEIVIVVVIMVLGVCTLGYLLLRTKPEIKHTKFGFFLERERFEDGDEDTKIVERKEWPKRNE